MEKDFYKSQKDPDSKSKLNEVYWGVIWGILGPLIGFWVYYLMRFFHKSPSAYIEMFFTVKQFQSPILSLALIFNLALFFIFLKFNFRSTALGILYATFVYIPVVVYLKFF